jgi:hypothetical protein
LHTGGGLVAHHDAPLAAAAQAPVGTEPLATLPHPAFVYTGRFQPPVKGSSKASARMLLVTGAADCALRLWDARTGTPPPSLPSTHLSALAA